MKISDRIKELRKSLKLSQEEFGHVLGVSRDVIGNIEYDRLKRPEQKEPIYKLICQKFNVSEIWLRTGDGEMFLPDEDEEAAYVSDLLEELDNDFYDLIKAIMKTYSESGEKEKAILKSFAKDLKNNLNKENRD